MFSRSQARRKIASIRLRLASRARFEIGDHIRREQAAERRQAKPLLAARQRRESDEQTFPAVVVRGPRRRGASRGRAARRRE